jgi:sugar phosphate isomerase/epimerase
MSDTQGVTRRDLLGPALASGAMLVASSAAARKWPLGINTYCLRFQRWNDRRLFDYSSEQRLDAIFLQDSLDPQVMDPKHWTEVRAWSKDLGLRLETGGGAILPKSAEAVPQVVATLRKNIDRASAMGSPIVRALLASDRYSMPPGPVEKHIETTIKILRDVRSQAIDAGVKIAIENHKELQAWETRQLIETAGKEFVGSYLDTGNPVFVAEDPLTTVEELGPFALTFHLRDSVVYEHPDGIAVQWVPLGEGTVDLKRLSRALLRFSPVLPFTASQSRRGRRWSCPCIPTSSGPNGSRARDHETWPDFWRSPNAAAHMTGRTSRPMCRSSVSEIWKR